VSEATPVGSAPWWAQRYALAARRRPRANGLTLERIMAAAVGILDDEGLDALSMRRLADALGTAHTSLYRHVASRDELLVLVVDHILGELRPAPADLSWRDQGEWLAREFRRVLLAHPAIVPLLTGGQLLGPNAMVGRERALSSLMAAGAEPEIAVHAYLNLAHFVIGSALLDTGGAARTAQHRRAMTALFRELPPEQFPTVSALAEQLNEPDADREFEFGLCMLLDGIERQITSLPADARRVPRAVNGVPA
jgi:AcrR family transcriptional regulator